MPVQRLKQYLDERCVKYMTLSHSPAYTAQEIAAATHVHGKEVIKTVIVKLDGTFVMAVLPAPYVVNLGALARGAGSETAVLASESEFRDLFPECEVGGMPPFGNLWNIPVYLDPIVSEAEHVTFNAGNHTEAIVLAVPDFLRLVEPKVVRFAERT